MNKFAVSIPTKDIVKFLTYYNRKRIDTVSNCISELVCIEFNGNKIKNNAKMKNIFFCVSNICLNIFCNIFFIK